MAFIEADIEKLAKFETESAEAISDFANIRTTFGEINSELLAKWKGEGAEAYKYETDHINEKIGAIDDILNGIITAVKDTKAAYISLDEELGAFNRNPTSVGGAE